MLPALVVLVFGDGCQCVLSGVLRGAGAQEVGARLNFCSYYLLGLPFGAALAFGAKVGLLGLWIGLALATNVQWMALAVFLRRMDWDEASAKAQAQAAAAGGGKAGATAAEEGTQLQPAGDERRGLLSADVL